MNSRQIPADAMVCGEPARACFTVAGDLTVCMSDGRTNSLSIKLTPEEARGFARVLEHFADLADEDGGLSVAECEGTA